MPNKGYSVALKRGAEALVAVKYPDIYQKVAEAVKLGIIPPDSADDWVQEAAIRGWKAVIKNRTYDPIIAFDNAVIHTIQSAEKQHRRQPNVVSLEMCRRVPSRSIDDDKIAREMEIPKAVETLPPKCRRVIDLLFNPGSGTTYARKEFDMTEEDAAKIIGVCPSRVGQLKAKAERMLRHPARTRNLRGIDY